MRANIQSMLVGGNTGPLLGGRIWGGSIAEQTVEEPYLVWFNRSAAIDNKLKNGTPCAVDRVFELRVWSKQFAFLRQVEQAIFDDIRDEGYVTNINDGWDEEVKLFFLFVDIAIFDSA